MWGKSGCQPSRVPEMGCRETSYKHGLGTGCRRSTGHAKRLVYITIAAGSRDQAGTASVGTQQHKAGDIAPQVLGTSGWAQEPTTTSGAPGQLSEDGKGQPVRTETLVPGRRETRDGTSGASGQHCPCVYMFVRLANLLSEPRPPKQRTRNGGEAKPLPAQIFPQWGESSSVGNPMGSPSRVLELGCREDSYK